MWRSTLRPNPIPSSSPSPKPSPFNPNPSPTPKHSPSTSLNHDPLPNPKPDLFYHLPPALHLSFPANHTFLNTTALGIYLPTSGSYSCCYCHSAGATTEHHPLVPHNRGAEAGPTQSRQLAHVDGSWLSTGLGLGTACACGWVLAKYSSRLRSESRHRSLLSLPRHTDHCPLIWTTGHLRTPASPLQLPAHAALSVSVPLLSSPSATMMPPSFLCTWDVHGMYMACDYDAPLLPASSSSPSLASAGSSFQCVLLSSTSTTLLALTLNIGPNP